MSQGQPNVLQRIAHYLHELTNLISETRLQNILLLYTNNNEYK
jgi:hypothetical protein